jgi:hypothetical protein
VAFEDDLNAIGQVVARVVRGDETLPDPDILRVVDEFDTGLTFRLGAGDAAIHLLRAIVPICGVRPQLSGELMPILVWAWGQGDEDVGRFALWLRQCAEHSVGNLEERE